MENPNNVLLVEDDPNLGQILKEYLELKNYEVTLCRDGEQGRSTFSKGKFDLCILDVMMPKIDGFELGKEIKQIESNVPLIYLTAKTMQEDTIKGLMIGADDYITKPFSMEELLLRIKAILKRTNPSSDDIKDPIEVGQFTFSPSRRSLTSNKTEKILTTKENALLKLLVLHQGRMVSRKLALKQIWGDDSYFNARSMDVYITKLRKILRPDESLKILTIHGEGFKLVKV